MASAPPSAPKSFPATACCEIKSLFFSHFHVLGFRQDAALGQSSQASCLPALPAVSFPGACCSVTWFSFFHGFVAVYHLCCSLLNKEGLCPLQLLCYPPHPQIPDSEWVNRRGAWGWFLLATRNHNYGRPGSIMCDIGFTNFLNFYANL